MKQFLSLFFWIVVTVSANAQQQISIFFDSNRHEVNVVELKRLTDWMNANKDSKIVAINGYTDEDGTNGFNDSLAKRRVNFIYSKIKGRVPIRDDFKTRSFGENFQQSKNKAENRKVTIYYILAKDLEREDEILGIKPKETPKIVEVVEIEPIEEETMNFPENATLEDKIGLSRKGTLIRLNDINFYLNSFAIMPTSKRAIDELIYVMNKFPKLKIEIQGHICCVDKDVKNLSTDRAKQVKRILVSEGISERRITVKGFGVSKPKFEIPEKSDYEAARNRRVEIMILEK
ncbi:MAG: OmpA family protein [Flavobacterium sp.]|nr:OmpA family protein [Flavobacterium sp.]